MRQRPELERFWEKVEKTGSCWLWTAGLNHSGYGMFRYNPYQSMALAHRYAWEKERGPIPDGMQLDHLCRVRACVNPAHLRVVTPKENILAPGSLAAAKREAEQTHCKYGHEFTVNNTHLSAGRRICRECKRRSNREYKQRLRLAA